MTITPDLPPKPTTGYAASKLAGERIGRSFSMRHDLTVICLRIGTIPPGDNPPDGCLSDWDQKCWLSNRDFCQAVEKAINAEGFRFATLNVMSWQHNRPLSLVDRRKS